MSVFQLSLNGLPKAKLVDAFTRQALVKFIDHFQLHGVVVKSTEIEGLDDDPSVIAISDEGTLFSKHDVKAVNSWAMESHLALNPPNNVYELHSNLEEDYLVDLNGKPFDPKPSFEHVNHSPDGFSFGYSGSGPAQLAFAVLLNETGNLELTYRLYQDFKFDFIAHVTCKMTPFVFTSMDVRNYLIALTDFNRDLTCEANVKHWRARLLEPKK